MGPADLPLPQPFFTLHAPYVGLADDSGAIFLELCTGITLPVSGHMTHVERKRKRESERERDVRAQRSTLRKNTFFRGFPSILRWSAWLEI